MRNRRDYIQETDTPAAVDVSGPSEAELAEVLASSAVLVSTRGRSLFDSGKIHSARALLAIAKRLNEDADRLLSRHTEQN